MDNAGTKLRWKGITGLAAIAALLVFVGTLPAEAQDQPKPKKKIGFSLKLSGGFGYLLDGAGDINNFRQGQKDALSALSADEGYAATFDWPRPWFLPDFTADIIINVGSHFGFGFGSGYILGSSRGRYAVNYQASGTFWGSNYVVDSKLDYRPDYQLRAVPLKFGLYLFQPLGKARKFTFFAHAGAGYYLGRAKFDRRFQSTSKSTEDYGYGTSSSSLDSQFDITESAKCNAWGYQGGLGLECKLSRALALGAEVCGRAVNFKSWEGDLLWTGKETYEYESPYWSYEHNDTENEKWHGSLWTYQIRDDEANKSYTYMMLLEKQPNDGYYKNVRKSALNLNALSLALSIKVHFDLF